MSPSVQSPAPGSAFVSFAHGTGTDEAVFLTTVKAHPGGQTAASTGTSAVVAGLTNGQAYTFTATHTYENGESSAASAASNTIVPRNLFAPENVAAVGGNLMASVS